MGVGDQCLATRHSAQLDCVQARARDLTVQTGIWAPKEARHDLPMNIYGGIEQGDRQGRSVVMWTVEKLMYLVGPGWSGKV